LVQFAGGQAGEFSGGEVLSRLVEVQIAAFEEGDRETGGAEGQRKSDARRSGADDAHRGIDGGVRGEGAGVDEHAWPRWRRF